MFEAKLGQEQKIFSKCEGKVRRCDGSRM